MHRAAFRQHKGDPSQALLRALQWPSPDVRVDSRPLAVACEALNCPRVPATLPRLTGPSAPRSVLTLRPPWADSTFRLSPGPASGPAPGLAHSYFRPSSNVNSEAHPISICSRLYLPSHRLVYFLHAAQSSQGTCLPVNCPLYLPESKLQEGEDLIRPIHCCVSGPQGTAGTREMFESTETHPDEKSDLNSWPPLSVLLVSRAQHS